MKAEGIPELGVGENGVSMRSAQEPKAIAAWGTTEATTFNTDWKR